jgi:biotin-(acetyl-CoA carboxylase) ligase
VGAAARTIIEGNQVMRSVIAVIALFALIVAPITPAQTQPQPQEQNEKIKKAVTKLSAGKDARVRLKLHDGKKVEGVIREIKGESLIVAELKTGATTEVGYQEISTVKGRSRSIGAKIAIGAGIAAAVYLTLVLIALQFGE